MLVDFGRISKLNLQQVSFSFWHFFLPSSLILKWHMGQIQNFVNPTQQNKKDYTNLVPHKDIWSNIIAFMCHWECCLIYTTLSPFQVSITNLNCLFKTISVMPWQAYTNITLAKRVLQNNVRKNDFPLIYSCTPSVNYFWNILQYIAQPYEIKSPFNSEPTTAHPSVTAFTLHDVILEMTFF